MSFAAFQNQFAVDWQAMDYDQTQDGMPPTTDGYYSHTHASYLTGSYGNVTYARTPYAPHGDISPPSSTTFSSGWCSPGNGPVSSIYDHDSPNSVSPVNDVYYAPSDNVNGTESLRYSATSSLLLNPEPNGTAYHPTVDNMPFTQNAPIGEFPQLVYSGNNTHHPTTVHSVEASGAGVGVLCSTHPGTIHAQVSSPEFGSYTPPQLAQLPPHSFTPSLCGSSMYSALRDTANKFYSPTSHAPLQLSPLSPLSLSPTPTSSTYEVEQAPYPSAHKTLMHTPPRNEQAQLSSDEISTAVESSQRCTVPGCNYSTWRKPDLRRHMESHRRDNDSKWVCCGVPLEEWLGRFPSEEEKCAADVREYYGRNMVGGCWKTFGRKDTLGRHLRDFGCMGHV